jgi:hypothetical protein
LSASNHIGRKKNIIMKKVLATLQATKADMDERSTFLNMLLIEGYVLECLPFR